MTGEEHADGSSKGWGFLSAMRFAERRAKGKPRIGKSTRVAQDAVSMGQDPFTGFPDSDLSQIDLAADPPRIRPRFLGFFGPFGPLPGAQTREVAFWTRNGDSSFVRFADIFVTRFQQLFYRSWSDARAITQFDHPTGGNSPVTCAPLPAMQVLRMTAQLSSMTRSGFSTPR
ncbi:type VI secretion system baseplate subunit TssG [Sulfitobacter albidus]|uniref:Type VI secretion system baseplate subunit TssG n=1 Tax=Sulfitobacter albidus TaxID=2829501 RepID=A0A975JGT0_9RHOB|nr:type VI secretion system baseplate subunit TssG [Sulfitobacter albidus]